MSTDGLGGFTAPPAWSTWASPAKSFAPCAKSALGVDAARPRSRKACGCPFGSRTTGNFTGAFGSLAGTEEEDASIDMVAFASNWIPAEWESGFPLPEMDFEGRGGRNELHMCGNDDSRNGANQTSFSQRPEMQQLQPTMMMMMQIEPENGEPMDKFELLGEPFDAESFVDRLVEDDPMPCRVGFTGGVADEGAVHHIWEAPPLAGCNSEFADASSTKSGMMCQKLSHVDYTWTPTGEAAATKLFFQPAFDWPQAQALGDQALGLGAVDASDAASAPSETNAADAMPVVVPHDAILDALLFTPSKMSPQIVPTVTSQQGLWTGSRSGSGEHDHGDSGSCGFPRAAGGAIAAGGDHFLPIAAAASVPSMAPVQIVVPMAPSRPQRQLSFGFGSHELASTTTWDTSVMQPQPQRQQLVSSVFALHQQQFGLGQQPQQLERGGTAGAGGCAGPKEKKPGSFFCGVSDIATGMVGACSDSTRSPTTLTGADSFSEEYDDERHAFLRRQELANFVGPGYLAGAGRPGLVTPAMRTALVDWLSRLHSSAPAASGGGPPLSLETFFLAVNVLDRFLSTAEGARTAFVGGTALKLVAAASLALASKYEDTQPVSLWGVASAASTGVCAATPGAGVGGRVFGGRGATCSDSSMGLEASCTSDDYSEGSRQMDVGAERKELVAMEMRVASALSFRLTVPTALSFLGVFLRRAVGLGYLARGQVAERVGQEARQILLCVLRDASCLEHPPSAVAAAALYWASCVTCPGETAPASFAFFAVTGYHLDKLCRCLRDMENIRTGGGGTGGGLHAAQLGGGEAGGGTGGRTWAGAAFPEHAENSLFGSGGGHPAIAAL